MPGLTGTSRRRSHLLRILGVGFGIAVGIGATIGGGILRTPGDIAAWVGTPQWLVAVWLLGGIYALLCANSLAELATLLPRAGGWYVYSQQAFGQRVGFIVGCCDWTMQAVANAYLAVAFGEFIGELFPAAAFEGPVLAVAGMFTLTLLNILGLRSGSRTQTLTSLVKAAALLALVGGCFWVAPGTASPAASAGPLPAGPGLSLGLLMAMQAVLNTYDGWYAPIYFAEEDQDPARDLPRSMAGTVLSCVVIFLLVNAAFVHSLGMGGLQHARMPAADASLAVFGAYGRQAVLAISVITVISTINANLLTGPRVLYGMARDRLLPAGLASVNRGGTPAWALLLCALASTALIFSGTLETLIQIDSVLFVGVYASGFASLLLLRHRAPQLPRPYRAWWYPWSTLCVLGASLLFLLAAVIGDLRHSLFTLLLVLASLLASLIFLRKGSVPAPLRDPEAAPRSL